VHFKPSVKDWRTMDIRTKWTRMWANSQRDGRSAEHRSHHVSKYGRHPTCGRWD